jgi:hypothetical protein
VYVNNGETIGNDTDITFSFVLKNPATGQVSKEPDIQATALTERKMSGSVLGARAKLITTSVSESSLQPGQINSVSFTLSSSIDLTQGRKIVITGLVGSGSSDNEDLNLRGTCAGKLDAPGSSQGKMWVQSSGTLTLVVRAGQRIFKNSDCSFTVDLRNPTKSQDPRPVRVSAPLPPAKIKRVDDGRELEIIFIENIKLLDSSSNTRLITVKRAWSGWNNVKVTFEGVRGMTELNGREYYLNKYSHDNATKEFYNIYHQSGQLGAPVDTSNFGKFLSTDDFVIPSTLLNNTVLGAAGKAWVVKTIVESTMESDQANTITATLRPSVELVETHQIVIAGLTGSVTKSNPSMGIGGAHASKFAVSGVTSKGIWEKNTGTLTLTVHTGQLIPTDSNTVVTFVLVNPTSHATVCTGKCGGGATTVSGTTSFSGSNEAGSSNNKILWTPDQDCNDDLELRCPFIKASTATKLPVQGNMFDDGRIDDRNPLKVLAKDSAGNILDPNGPTSVRDPNAVVIDSETATIYSDSGILDDGTAVNAQAQKFLSRRQLYSPFAAIQDDKAFSWCLTGQSVDSCKATPFHSQVSTAGSPTSGCWDTTKTNETDCKTAYPNGGKWSTDFRGKCCTSTFGLCGTSAARNVWFSDIVSSECKAGVKVHVTRMNLTYGGDCAYSKLTLSTPTPQKEKLSFESEVIGSADGLMADLCGTPGEIGWKKNMIWNACRGFRRNPCCLEKLPRGNLNKCFDSRYDSSNWDGPIWQNDTDFNTSGPVWVQHFMWREGGTGWSLNWTVNSPTHACAECYAGRYSLPGSYGNSSCVSCPVGKYSAELGTPECLLCPVGQFNDSTGKTECHRLRLHLVRP